MKTELKALLAALAAAALLAGGASAQTTSVEAGVQGAASNCPAVSPEPALPDGARASDRQMSAGGEAYTAWATSLRAGAECLRARFDASTAERRAQEQAYNALNARLREVSGRWAEQRNLFCAQPRRRCRAIDPAELAAPPQTPQAGPCADSLGVEEPVIPNAAGAAQAAFDAADAAVIAWGRAAQANLQCRRAAYERLSAQSEALGGDYNTLARRLAAATTAWEAELAEFCARPRKQCEGAQQQ